MSETKTQESQKRIAVVRVRGECKLKQGVEDTLKMLRLYKKNSCVILSNMPAYTGMLVKVKDFITWGEINEPTFKELIMKRGKLPGKISLTEQYLKDKVKLGFEEFTKEFFNFKKELKDVPGLKPFFKLHPPRHGFERKGIKSAFSMGGALGYRKEQINDLITRML